LEIDWSFQETALLEVKDQLIQCEGLTKQFIAVVHTFRSVFALASYQVAVQARDCFPVRFAAREEGLEV
jgi:hypothetical protein